MTQSHDTSSWKRLHPVLVAIVMLAVANAVLVVISLAMAVAFAGTYAVPGLLLSALFVTAPFAVLMVMRHAGDKNDAARRPNA
jgi:ABC-type sulfate transport system permease subunit